MGEDWLHQTVDVDIQSLLDFATRMQTAVEEYGTSLADGVAPLMTGVRPAFGGLILSEGKYFGATHANQVEAAKYLMNDVMTGLSALATAAAGVAAEYLSGDALSDATVDDVYDAFVPASGSAGTADQQASVAVAAEPVAAEEDPVLPPEAYGDQTSPQDGSGHYVAEGKPGEFWIGDDDERMDSGVPDAPEPRR